MNQHYHPDVASTGQHLTDLAEFLAARGHAVRVLTGRGHYVAGQVAAPRRERRNGVDIRRVRTTTFGRATRLGRVVDYATFYLGVLWTVATIGDRRGELTIVFLTTPPLLAVAGWFGAILRGRRYGIWSMDLHPDAEIGAGMIKRSSLLGRALRWLDEQASRRATFIVDLGVHMKFRLLEKGVEEKRTHTIPVWGHREPTNEAGSAALRHELGLDGRFVVMYSGNAGLVHDFKAILWAIRLLRDDPTIYFLFAGGGPRRGEIEAFIAEWHLTNVTYRPYFERDQLGDALAVGDAHLVSLGEPFAGISVPGKLYGIMAAARPVLFVGPGPCETGQTIRETGCGVTIQVTREDAAETIASVLRRWRDDRQEPRGMGERGRRAFEETYTADVNCEKFAELLEALP